MPRIIRAGAQGQEYSIFAGTADPNSVETPDHVGDLYFRMGSAENAQIYAARGTTSNSWVPGLVTANWEADRALSWLLQDNVDPALSIGSFGLTALLQFKTSNGFEQITYNGTSPFVVNGGGISIAEGGLLTPQLAFPDYAAGTPHPGLVLGIAHPGGAADASAVLPARVGGWRITDARVRSEGATGGSLTVRTAAGGGGNAVTDAIVPGNADAITRAARLVQADEDFASGATVYVRGAGGTPASTVYLSLVGL